MKKGIAIITGLVVFGTSAKLPKVPCKSKLVVTYYAKNKKIETKTFGDGNFWVGKVNLEGSTADSISIDIK